MRKFWIPILILLLIAIVQFVPMISLSTMSMKTTESENIVYYYESEDESIISMISGHLDDEVELIDEKLNFVREQKSKIYVYPDQKIFHRKKYGSLIDIVKLFNNLDWYIGDNIREDVLIVSPLMSGNHHSLDSVIGAIPHEYVHTVMYHLNPDISLWLNEGMALYLTNGERLRYAKLDELPTFDQIQTNNPIEFSNIGGYQFAHSYIEFLENEYGFDLILEYINENQKSEKVFGVSEDVLYEKWIEYLRNTYTS
jgi:hypothetical protein